MRRIYNIILLLELVSLVLLPIVTWAMSMMGSDVVNLFSEDSLRWLFMHFGEMLLPRHFAAIILFLTVLGIWQEPGVRDFRLKGWKAYVGYFLFLFLLQWLLRWPAIFGYTPLLGIDGSEVPSPWFSFSPYVFCITMTVAAMTIAYSNGVATTFSAQFELVQNGIRRHAPWLLVIMLGSLLYSVVRHVFLL